MNNQVERIDHEQSGHGAAQRESTKRGSSRLSREDILAWAQSVISQQAKNQPDTTTQPQTR